MKIIVFYTLGLVFNYVGTYLLHGLARKISNELAYESRLRKIYKYSKYSIYAITPDYVIARKFKGKIN